MDKQTSETDRRHEKLLERIEKIQQEMSKLHTAHSHEEWRSTVLQTLEMALEEVRMSETQMLESTERLVESRKRLDEQRRYYQSLFELAPDALFVTRPDGTIRACNTSAGELLGVRDDLLSGKPIPIFVATEVRDDFYRQLERVAGGRDVQGWETKLQLRSGESFPAEISARRFDPELRSGGEHELLWVVRDTSEDRKLRDRMHRSQMRESVGQMAAGIAHEFNNILGLVTTWCELGLRDTGGEVEPEDAFERIKRAAERGAELSETILAYSRDKEVDENRLVEIGHLLESTASTLEVVLPSTIQLQYEEIDDLLEVQFDPGLLQQVLINLVLNARDAIESTGEIRLAARREVLEYSTTGLDDTSLDPGEYATFSVIDDGCGMDEEVLESAADPFFTTKSDGGTGLGLPTVVDLVDRADGMVEIDSATGEGTEVTVYLPSATGSCLESNSYPCVEAPSNEESSDTVSAEETPELENPAAKTVLLVCDDAPVRGVLRHYLRNDGFQTVEAIEPPDAIDVVENRPNGVDLAVVDAILSTGDWREVADQLEDNYDLSVVCLEGQSEEESEGREDDWERPVVRRPVRADQLMATVRRALQR